MSVYFKDKIGINIAGRTNADFTPEMSMTDVIKTLGEPFRKFRTSRGRMLMYLLDMTRKKDKDKANLAFPLILYIEKNRLSKIEDYTSNTIINVVIDEDTHDRVFMITRINK